MAARTENRTCYLSVPFRNLSATITSGFCEEQSMLGLLEVENTKRSVQDVLIVG